MLPNWFTEIRGKVPRKAAIALGLIPILITFALWWYMTKGAVEERRISALNLPSPGDVMESVGPMLHQPDNEGRTLTTHLYISLMRVGLSFLIALAITLPLGIGMGAFGSIRAVFMPLATISGYVPIATLVPLTMSLFGTGEEQKIVFLALAYVIYLLPMIVKAIDGVPSVYLRTAYTLGASRMESVFKVLVPVALPDIWHGMRLAFGVGWTYLVLAEVVVKQGGLGDMIGNAQRLGKPGRVWLIILIISVVAWIADILWEHLGRLIFPYRSTQR